MNPSFTIQTLTKAHNRNAFDCGDEALNVFLQKIARQHNEKGLSKTFVLIDSQYPADIIAYMTLVVCEVLADEIPHQWKKKYPQRIPAAKLARLAVSHEQQRKGYGQLMLIDALQKTLNVSYAMGIAGLFVDAKHAQAHGYYQQFGFLPLEAGNQRLFLPLKPL